jgi:V/A-type H+-transporting ATPase subunit B
MNDGIGENKTREDHSALASQLYAAYAQVRQIEKLAAIIGEEEISELDRLFLEFGDTFEKTFIAQGREVDRSIEDTLNLGWKCLSVLPEAELTRVKGEQIQRYLRKKG